MYNVNICDVQVSSSWEFLGQFLEIKNYFNIKSLKFKKKILKNENVTKLKKSRKK